MTSVLAVLEQHRAMLSEASLSGARLGSLDDLAAAWRSAGYESDSVVIWLSHRCPSPTTAACLEAASLTRFAGDITDHGDGPAREEHRYRKSR